MKEKGVTPGLGQQWAARNIRETAVQHPQAEKPHTTPVSHGHNPTPSRPTATEQRVTPGHHLPT
jgi:hypothetical protein